MTDTPKLVLLFSIYFFAGILAGSMLTIALAFDGMVPVPGDTTILVDGERWEVTQFRGCRGYGIGCEVEWQGDGWHWWEILGGRGGGPFPTPRGAMQDAIEEMQEPNKGHAQ